MLWIFILGFLLSAATGDEHTHHYKDAEQVVLWMNTVSPYHNKQETYKYFSLPFCKGPQKNIEHYHETLAEALTGVELEFSGLDIRFKQAVPKTVFCTSELTAEGYEDLKHAVDDKYWYQMYLDGLLILAVLGETNDRGEAVLWTHKLFEIHYNRDQIIRVTLTTSSPVVLKPGISIPFSYEVVWVESGMPFESRYDQYLDVDFFQHRVHWFSIFNSFMMVIFLVALVSMILLRTLRKDYARYNKEDALEDLERELGDDYGWKQVHGDVFRPPVGAIYLASLVGTGMHIALVSVAVTALAFVGKMYTERGGLLSTVIFVYALLSPVNGFFGGRLYPRLGGSARKTPITTFPLFIGSLLLPALISAIACGINVLATFYQTSRVIPFLSMLAVVSIVVFVIVPLNLVGTVIGRNVGGPHSNPCRVNAVPRPIPEAKWFTRPLVISLLGGILPFGSIFIEMYFIFTSFWAYKIYFVFGFTLLVILILIAVTSCVSVVCSYFLLNGEDYRWQWVSFCSGASTAVYIYLYSIYYFIFKTRMFGLFQTVFYFGYMAFFCVALGCMCGAVGYLASSVFVRKIYSTVKID
nr:unnamed protein product [Spirometra erinaceieuropaei]